MTLLYAIGDVHGCAKEMRILLDAIDKDRGEKPSKIIFVGDYVDRGPDTKGVIKTLMARQDTSTVEHIFLKGNHEDMMLHSYEDWMLFGGRETIKSYDGNIPQSHIEWISSLRTLYKFDKFVFSHAGIHPSLKAEENVDIHLMWNRDYDKFNGDYTYGYQVTHGHTPYPGVKIQKNKINIDTGCVFGGNLTAVRYDADNPIAKPIFLTVKRGRDFAKMFTH